LAAAARWRRPARNRALGRIRAPVERTFAILKRWYGYGRVRYRSLGRNALQLLAVALNLRCAPGGEVRPDHGRTTVMVAKRRKQHPALRRSAQLLPVPTPRGNKCRRNSKRSRLA
jgi:hypothetical protein